VTTEDPGGEPPLSERRAAGPVASVAVAYRVRFDECTPSGEARASAYLRYAQDVAWIHSERLGYDRAWYDARSIAWVVRGIQLVILEPSGTGDGLSVSTRVTGFRRVWARRRTEFRSGDDRLAAWAYTDWVMTDARGMPTRVPAEFAGRFSVPPATFEPTRVALAPVPDDASLLRFAVRPQELDPMGHVNNAVYADWVDEAVAAASVATAPGAAAPPVAPVAAVPRRYRLEYLLPVPPATRLVASTWTDGRSVSCLLRDEAGREHLRARLEPGLRDPVEQRSALDPA
jgi:acyl-CoA thioesterase FadM